MYLTLARPEIECLEHSKVAQLQLTFSAVKTRERERERAGGRRQGEKGGETCREREMVHSYCSPHGVGNCACHEILHEQLRDHNI